MDPSLNSGGCSGPSPQSTVYARGGFSLCRFAIPCCSAGIVRAARESRPTGPLVSISRTGRSALRGSFSRRRPFHPRRRPWHGQMLSLTPQTTNGRPLRPGKQGPFRYSRRHLLQRANQARCASFAFEPPGYKLCSQSSGRSLAQKPRANTVPPSGSIRRGPRFPQVMPFLCELSPLTASVE